MKCEIAPIKGEKIGFFRFYLFGLFSFVVFTPPDTLPNMGIDIV